jgi:alpha-tubulin suppressor-like RCC1 family protein
MADDRSLTSGFRKLLFAGAFVVPSVLLPREALAERLPSTVSAGRTHSCAISSTGTLWCWGANGAGQLGDGTTNDSPVPVQVSQLGKAFTEVSVGDLFTCARTTDGSAYCWGSGAAGQLGNGGLNDSSIPVLVSIPGGGVAQLSAGDLFACALKTDGTLYCWGGGGFLGDGTGNASALPVQVTSLGNAVAEVSAGDTAACARKTDGTLWCWGSNTFGIVGDGTTDDRMTPVQVNNLGGAVAEVSVGDLFACARKVDNTLSCWGTNDQGQLGDGSNASHFAPAAVTSLGNTVASISANGRHTCARRTDASLWCWGWNASGELGDGTTASRPSPAQVTPFGAGASDVSAGGDHDTCAHQLDGSLWCWGSNVAGKLGDGTTTDRRSPVQVVSFGASAAVPATGIGSLAVLAGVLALLGLARGRSRDTRRV